MSARYDKWNGEDGESTPLPSTPCRGAMEEQLERLKEQLLAPLLSSVTNAALVRELRWVANEAAALAWLTACPVLVLPTLLEEKIRTALQRWERQQRLWSRDNYLSPVTNEPWTAGTRPRFGCMVERTRALESSWMPVRSDVLPKRRRAAAVQTRCTSPARHF